LFGEGEFNRFLYMRRFHDSLVRGFGMIMAFDGFRSDSFFRDELYGRAEEVVEESPFLGIEVVKRFPNVLFFDRHIEFVIVIIGIGCKTVIQKAVFKCRVNLVW
jgi:hypothetical protein